ncbi:filamentous haemagglutinin outer membrane protein [Rivularia sp. IAM M-261]|nr:filamentous haemagglutinin outer membrane protein [Rivularia sp. IAM M-261]
MTIRNQGLFQKLLFCSFLVLINTSANAQITPDNTLREETSKLTPNVLINGASADLINGGALRGSNLFHSFGEFNIKDGQGVYFANPSGVVNILTRVTGSNASNILGTLGVNGTANLFLINPNGILFGKNASLDIKGSFVGTTANGVQFGSQGNFSATEPLVSGLLTVNPSALLFNQINPNAGIVNNSVAPVGADPAGFRAFGLRVPDGNSLLLVGGNVTMDKGRLHANGGRVELGGLSEPGTITLLLNGDNLSLKFPENVARASVSLTNQAGIYVASAGSGNIAINAKNLEILGESILSGGIEQGLGISEAVAGDIWLNSTGKINIVDSATIINNVRQDSKGNAGNINVVATGEVSLVGASILSQVEPKGMGKSGHIRINTASLRLQDDAQILTSIKEAGNGNAGNVDVKVTGVVDIAGKESRISTRVNTGAEGNAGNITIDADSFKSQDGASINASNSGPGNAGNVNIKTKSEVSLADTSILTNVEVGSIGKGGDILINAGKLSLRNGTQIEASTSGQGDGGNVNVVVKGEASLVNALILSQVEAGGTGKGGDIYFEAASLKLQNGAQILTSIKEASDGRLPGNGEAGNVKVKVAGAVDIVGKKVSIGKDDVPSEIGSRVNIGAEGKGGNIIIDSSSLNLQDGAVVTASTLGKGDAGNVNVIVKGEVFLDGSIVSSQVEAGGIGKGGDIYVEASSLKLQNGGQILTSIREAFNKKEELNWRPPGKGDAGNVKVKVAGEIYIAGKRVSNEGKDVGSGISSRVNMGAEGNGGDIIINTGSLNLQGDGFVTTSTFGLGDAGTIKVNTDNFLTISGNYSLNSGLFVNSQSTTGVAGDIIVASPKITLDNQGTLNANSTSGNGGNIKLNSDLLLLLRGAQISTNAGTEQLGGDGGNIDVDSRFIVAVPTENSDITANAFTGRGGNVNIRTQGIFGIEPRATESPQTSDITASSQRGVQGEVSIIEPDVEPEQGLIELPEEVVDATRRVAQICPREPGAKPLGKFTITGRGSLPPSPLEALPGTTNNTKLATLDSNNTNVSNIVPNKVQNAIVEAQGWVKNNDGSLELVAEAPNTTPSARATVATCPTSSVPQ